MFTTFCPQHHCRTLFGSMPIFFSGFPGCPDFSQLHRYVFTLAIDHRLSCLFVWLANVHGGVITTPLTVYSAFLPINEMFSGGIINGGSIFRRNLRLYLLREHLKSVSGVSSFIRISGSEALLSRLSPIRRTHFWLVF